MEQNKILLLSQLVSILKENAETLSEAYTSQDKEKFDSAKSAVLEAQRKINFILNEVK